MECTAAARTSLPGRRRPLVLSQIDELIPGCRLHADLEVLAGLVKEAHGEAVRFLLADALIAMAQRARKDGYSLSWIGETAFNALQGLHGRN